MIKSPKIVIIGAGSAIFGLGALVRIMRTEKLKGAELAMVDIDEGALATMTAVARRMNEAWDAQMTITESTERTDVMQDADFVIVSVQVGPREEVWEMDWRIPLKHGIRQPYAENSGPGAFAHTARNMPLILDIARDMERLCPNAWYLNQTNPLIRLSLGVSRYTNIKVLGMCHQLLWGYAMAATVLSERLGITIPEHFHVHTDASNMPQFLPVAVAGYKQLEIKAAGINHFSWVYDIRDRKTGEDLYPLVRENWLRNPRWEDFEPLSREMFEIYGMMPTAGDSHMCEYLQVVHDPITKPWEKYDLKLQSWDGNRVRRASRKQIAGAIADGSMDVNELVDLGKFDIIHEPIPEIITAITFNQTYFSDQLNIPNHGLIPNLPDDAIVEVPGIVSSMGIQGLNVPPLPEPIAEMCRRELAYSSLVVDAVVKGDRELALQALLLDPMVNDIGRARAILGDFLHKFEQYLPQFA